MSSASGSEAANPFAGRLYTLWARLVSAATIHQHRPRIVPGPVPEFVAGKLGADLLNSRRSQLFKPFQGPAQCRNPGAQTGPHLARRRLEAHRLREAAYQATQRPSPDQISVGISLVIPRLGILPGQVWPGGSSRCSTWQCTTAHAGAWRLIVFQKSATWLNSATDRIRIHSYRNPWERKSKWLSQGQSTLSVAETFCARRQCWGGWRLQPRCWKRAPRPEATRRPLARPRRHRRIPRLPWLRR